MSEDKPKPKKRLAFTATEVRRFFVEAQSLSLRADALLADHYTTRNVLHSREVSSRVHEILLEAHAFREMLEIHFVPEPGKTHYEVDVEVVLGLSKITAMLNVNRSELLKAGISLETQ